MIFMGIDPGKSGGIARIHGDGVFWCKLDATEGDIIGWLRTYDLDGCYAVIERVSSSPQMGVTSAFTFGRSYGFLRGCLAALSIPYVEVTPAKWQRAMGCLSGGDKNVTKQKAQQLYPDVKITHANADALLLATYCRQKHGELF